MALYGSNGIQDILGYLKTYLTQKFALKANAADLNNKVDKITGKSLSTNDYTNTDKQIVDGVTAALAGKANTTDIASEFDDTVAYAVGNICTKDGKLYRCTTAHSAGAWNNAHFTETTIDETFLRTNTNSGDLQSVKGLVEFDNDVLLDKNGYAFYAGSIAESLAYREYGTTAHKLYNAGDRFVLNGYLCEAITTINGGSAIVVTEGATQNARRITVDELIGDLDSSVSGKTDLSVVGVIESTSTASKAYAIDEGFVYNGKYYRAISAIAQGDTIVVSGAGANAVESTLDGKANKDEIMVAYSSDNKYVSITLKNGLTVTDIARLSAVGNVSSKADISLLAYVNSRATASKALSVGDLIVWKDSSLVNPDYKLYRVTQDIISGGTISSALIGGNVVVTTIADEIASKADKVTNATSGNFAGLDANGNLTDSGKKASDFTGKSFDGTSQEWDALSAAQKAEYAAGLVLIKNDTANAMLVDSTPTEGSNNLVKSGGVYSHYICAGKQSGTTLGAYSTAEGHNTEASGLASHAEGWVTKADGAMSHAEGSYTRANGHYSHAEGYYALASGQAAHASGCYTKATKANQTVIGRYNDYETYTAEDADGVYAFLIGNGTADNARHNAFAVKWDGTHEMNGDVVIGQHYDSTQSQNVGSNLTVSGVVNVNGSDYAEKFESIEDCPVGRFVTLDGEKIRLAQPEDDYILGVTSEAPAIVGDKDNPGIPVGLVGKLWVEHDGTAEVNGYVCCGKDGIATMELHRQCVYRVMAVDGNRAKILVR